MKYVDAQKDYQHLKHMYELNAKMAEDPKIRPSDVGPCGEIVPKRFGDIGRDTRDQ